MTENRFKIGDWAVIDCDENSGVHQLVGEDDLVWIANNPCDPGDNCWHRTDSGRGSSAQWVAIVNPADEEQMTRLATGWVTSPASGPRRAREAVESLRTPPPPPLPPEPPVGSRVMDRDGNLWTREPDGWCGHESWHRLLSEHGPVRLVTLSDPIGGDGDE